MGRGKKGAFCRFCPRFPSFELLLQDKAWHSPLLPSLPSFSPVYVCLSLCICFSIQNKWQSLTKLEAMMSVCCVQLNLNAHTFSLCPLFLINACSPRSVCLIVSGYTLWIAREGSFVFFIYAKLANQLLLGCVQKCALFVN